jgi:hypothetical protein
MGILHTSGFDMDEDGLQTRFANMADLRLTFFQAYTTDFEDI